MKTTAIVCVTCNKIIAVGASLPATCLAAVPEADRRRLPGTDLDAHPAAHRSCVELEILAPDELEGAALLEEVGRQQAEALGALASLAELGGGPAVGGGG
jgi:hypothetical protein